MRLQQEGAEGEGPPVVVEETGSPCNSGPAKEKCTSDLAALHPTGGWGPSGGRRRFLVTTTGDQISVYDTIEKAAELLAPIESAQEAVLLTAGQVTYGFVACGEPNVVQSPEGWMVLLDEIVMSCGPHVEPYRTLLVTPAGAITTVEKIDVQKPYGAGCPGRRPEGLYPCRPCDSADPLGRFFAAAAHLEAASVVSFERLSAELRTLGAPAALIHRALASGEDEVRHARMTSKMARRFGAESRPVEVAPAVARSALQIALENATEGCVRETYAALVAHWQATAATDGAIKCMMQLIAQDETRHAALAWDVAAWLEPLLSTAERELVENARQRTIAKLRAELSVEPTSELKTAAGMPDAVAAIALLDALDTTFLAAA